MECRICYENNKIDFWTCKQCEKTVCTECIETIKKINYKCPYCRHKFQKYGFMDLLVFMSLLDDVSMINEVGIILGIF